MTYYEILGISQNSTEKEIKKSYKNLIKKYHPDIYNGDKIIAENKTKEINEAYEVLSNPTLRQDYDNMISTHFEDDDILNDNEEKTQDTYNSENIMNRYNDFLKRHYTTNYYGVSRDDLNKEKKKTYNRSLHSEGISKNKILVLIAIIGLVIIFALIFLLSYLRSMLSVNYISPLYQNVQKTEYDNTEETFPYIYFGLSFSKVKNLLGNPDYTEKKDNKTYAYYNNSYIVFGDDDLVVDWLNNGDFYTDAKNR